MIAIEDSALAKLNELLLTSHEFKICNEVENLFDEDTHVDYQRQAMRVMRVLMVSKIFKQSFERKFEPLYYKISKLWDKEHSKLDDTREEASQPA